MSRSIGSGPSPWRTASWATPAEQQHQRHAEKRDEKDLDQFKNDVSRQEPHCPPNHLYVTWARTISTFGRRLNASFSWGPLVTGL